MNKNKSGFVLVELLVSMAILITLIAMAVPAFKTTSINDRLYSEANQVTSMLTLARIEALRRNDYVSICASTNGSTCSNSTDFSQGMAVFLNSGQTGLSSSSQVIKLTNAFNALDKAKLNTGTIITFGADGRSNQAQSLLVCSPAQTSYSVSLLASGLINLTSNQGDGGC